MPSLFCGGLSRMFHGFNSSKSNKSCSTMGRPVQQGASTETGIWEIRDQGREREYGRGYLYLKESNEARNGMKESQSSEAKNDLLSGTPYGT